MALRVSVTQFNSMPNVAGGTAQMASLKNLGTQTQDVAGGALRFGPMTTNTKYVRIACEGRASAAEGDVTVVAATTDMPIMAGIPECFGIEPGRYISVVANP